MTLAARLAARKRFDRLSRAQLEELVDTLREQRDERDTELRALRKERDHAEQRLLGRAYAHEADARHRDTGIDRAKWHQAIADELRDAARDIGKGD